MAVYRIAVSQKSALLRDRSDPAIALRACACGGRFVPMEYESKSIQCPNCGAPLSDVGKNVCDHCGSTVVVRRVREAGALSPLQLSKYASFYRGKTDGASQFALGCCQMQLKQFTFAAGTFRKLLAEVPDNAMAYYYLALAVLAGKRPFVQPRPVIDEAESCLESAAAIEPHALFFYLRAFIRNDYFERKRYHVQPDSAYFLSLAEECGGISDDERDELFELMNCDPPAGF